MIKIKRKPHSLLSYHGSSTSKPVGPSCFGFSHVSTPLNGIGKTYRYDSLKADLIIDHRFDTKK